MQTDTTTPNINIYDPTMLGVVASVCMQLTTMSFVSFHHSPPFDDVCRWVTYSVV